MRKEIYFAGGCFWGCEKFFSLIQGVASTSVGYANGKSVQTTYEDVCKGSGHAEVVQVIFDDNKLSYDTLLEAYFKLIDPFAINQQGNDKGVQYRTGIYSTDDQVLEKATEYIAHLQENEPRKIQVEAAPLQHYILAEEYHQEYLDKNPNGYCHIGQSAFEYAKNV